MQDETGSSGRVNPPTSRAPRAREVSSEHRTFAVYFLAQAAVGLFFWFVVTGSDEGRRLFELLPGHPRVTDAFLWADLLAVGTSLACAWALSQGARWALPVVAFTTGCIVYPTVYLIAWAPSSAGGAHCLFIMVPPSLIGIWITHRVWRNSGAAAEIKTP